MLRLWDLVVVAAVVTLLFGAKRLPGTARALGRSVRILRTQARGGEPAPAGTPRVLTARRVGAAEAPAAGTTPAEHGPDR